MIRSASAATRNPLPAKSSLNGRERISGGHDALEIRQGFASPMLVHATFPNGLEHGRFDGHSNQLADHGSFRNGVCETLGEENVVQRFLGTVFSEERGGAEAEREADGLARAGR